MHKFPAYISKKKRSGGFCHRFFFILTPCVFFPALWIFSAYSRISSSSFSRRIISFMTKTTLIGVRISWLICARNWDFGAVTYFYANNASTLSYSFCGKNGFLINPCTAYSPFATACSIFSEADKNAIGSSASSLLARIASNVSDPLIPGISTSKRTKSTLTFLSRQSKSSWNNSPLVNQAIAITISSFACCK